MPPPAPTVLDPSHARSAAVCIVAAGSAFWLAALHPIAPGLAVFGVAAWMSLTAFRPYAWVALLPAVLPVASFSPWTGWVVFEELDLLILATVAVGYGRMAVGATAIAPRWTDAGRWWLCAFVVTTAWSLSVGWLRAEPAALHLFQGYDGSLNAVRVAKSGVWAVLLFPLWCQAFDSDRRGAWRRLAVGMTIGALLASVGALWERAAFPGLLDLSAPYRTAGLFWEMHVGGAALDAYVVVATPFVAWSLWAARSRVAWSLAASSALLWAYAALTTFARGAYLGVAVGLVVLGSFWPVHAPTGRASRAARVLACGAGSAVLLWLTLDEWGVAAALMALAALAAAWWLAWHRSAGRRERTLAAGLLALALLFEAVLVFGPDAFMRQRSAASVLDSAGRIAHWTRGLTLLDGAADWLGGIGLGRLPGRYDRDVPGGEMPGHATWLGPAALGRARIEGPRTLPDLAGRHGLTQRVKARAAYTVRLQWRSARPARMLVRVCESHLLYVHGCQWARLRLSGDASGEWHSIEAPLRGPPLSHGRAWAPRQTVLTLSVLDVGGAVEVDDVSLRGPDGENLVDNGDFARGFAHWLPAAQSYFVPWHIDNLYLELLIERGLLGAGVLLLAVLAALRRSFKAAASGDDAAPFLAASLSGTLAFGLLSSLQDMPRVALIAALLVGVALAISKAPSRE